MTAETFADNLDLMGEVPESSGGFKSIGQLTISTRLFVWKKITQPDGSIKTLSEEASVDEWKRTPKVVDGKGAKGMDIIFHVNVQELRTSLQYPYERKVTLNSMDWDKLVAPSIEKVMGAGSMKDDKRSETLRNLNGKYVMVQDVPQIPRKNAVADAKQYNTVSLLKVYGSREEAYAESKAMGGGESANGNGAAASNPNVPTDYTAETWAMCKDDLVKAVSDAVNSVKPAPKKAEAKVAAVAKFALEYGATVDQVMHLLDS